MDLSIKDVPHRVAQYFRLFERIIADNSFQENLGRAKASDDDYVPRVKQRTKILVENPSPAMLRDEIKGMLELVKCRHIRINDQLLYKLILERPEHQQLFYNCFRQQEQANAAPKTGNRKGGKPTSNSGSSKQSSAPRNADGDDHQSTSGKAGSQVRNTMAGFQSQRPPSRTGCLHCKGEHWLRDCPVVTPAEKEEARIQKAKSWKANRAVVGKPTSELVALQQKENTVENVLDDDECTVLINGAVEISICPDTGAEKCILPASAVEQVRMTGQTLVTNPMPEPVPVIGVGGKVTLSHETVQIDLQIRTSAGPVNLYKLECLVVEGEDQFLLSKTVMKRLGIDFEQLAKTSIDLNQDDIPDEPEVGARVEDEIQIEMERMCEEVRAVLSEGQYASFREDVIKLSKHLYICTAHVLVWMHPLLWSR